MSQSIGYVHLTVGYLHMYISIAKEHMKSKTSKILEMMEMEQYIYNIIIYIYFRPWYGMVPPGQLPLQLRPALPKAERDRNGSTNKLHTRKMIGQAPTAT